MAGAELRGTLLAVQLGAQDEPLIGRQLADRAGETRELFALEDARERIAASAPDRVGDRVQRRGVVQRSGDRAAPAERALAVDDPRLEALVERRADRVGVGEALSACCGGEQFERRLAEAVLEVCSFESVVVDAQQTLPAADRDRCDHLRGIRRPRAGHGATSCSR